MRPGLWCLISFSVCFRLERWGMPSICRSQNKRLECPQAVSHADPSWPNARRVSYCCRQRTAPDAKILEAIAGTWKQHHALLWRITVAWLILMIERTQYTVQMAVYSCQPGTAFWEEAETLAGTTEQGWRSLGVRSEVVAAGPQQEESGSLSQSQSSFLLLPSSCGS